MSTAAASKAIKDRVAEFTRQNSQRAAASKCRKKLMELAVVCHTPSPVAREAAEGVSKRSKRFREQIIDAEPSNDWKTGTGSASSYAAFEDQGANLLAPIKTETVDEGNDSDVPQSPSKRPRRACCAPARLHDHVIEPIGSERVVAQAMATLSTKPVVFTTPRPQKAQNADVSKFNAVVSFLLKHENVECHHQILACSPAVH